MGKISNWNSEVRDYLTRTYRYDKESGLVFRNLEPNRGPKQAGSVGSVNRNELIIVVNVEKKSYLIRLHKLAVFLETGFLYEKITHKDGNSLNNKWENLIPVGNPVSLDDNQAEMSEDEKLLAIHEYKEKQAAILAEIEQKKEVKPEPVKKGRTATAKKTRVTEPWKPIDYGALHMQAEKVKAYEMAHEFSQEREKVLRQFTEEARLKERQVGVFTGMEWYDASIWLDRQIEKDGVSATEFMNMHKANKAAIAEGDDKELHDRLFVSTLQHYNHALTPAMLITSLSLYRWKGEVVPKPNTLNSKALDIAIQALRDKHNTNEEEVRKWAEMMARPPFDEREEREYDMMRERAATLSKLDKVGSDESQQEEEEPAEQSEEVEARGN